MSDTQYELHGSLLAVKREVAGMVLNGSVVERKQKG